jgi:glycosyltransferase involved in cell wall biosynthesis
VRVLHVCPYMHHSAGGPPVVVERLCLLAPSGGWESSVITTSLYCNDNGGELEASLRRRIDVKVLPIRKPRFLRRANGAADAVDEAVRIADIVHLHTLWNPLNTVTRKACMRHGRKYVMMPHGMLDPYALTQKLWRKKVYLAAAERRNLQGACRLIFTTFHEQQAAQERLPWLGQGEIIPLGADRPPDMPRQGSREPFINSFPKAANRRCILFLGRIHPKKGIDRLLKSLPEIVSRHPAVLLIIAGDGDPSFVQGIKKLVYARNLSPHVLFTGSLQEKIKWSAFACAEVFVLPSRQENFAISVAEAMHSGVPVVITDRVNCWPFVKEAGAGFVIEEDKLQVSLAEYLDELLSDSATALRMGMRGQQFAKDRLSWERVTRDIVALYERILEESQVKRFPAAFNRPQVVMTERLF